jgi:hypothetical protein
MSQYKTGTATVTNGSATVTGTNTLWLANVTAGYSFTVAGDGVMYYVASVDSDTQITLSVAYAGVTASGVVYAIGTGFTVPDNFPEMSQGDIETATIFTRAMRKIQGKFTAIVSDISTNTSDIAISVAGKAREDLLKQATLSLDFANNKYEVYEGPVNSLTQMPFNEALDFTRGSAATARTATGKIQEVAIDEQRLVGNREGLLIEEQRTNDVIDSEDLTNAVWAKRGVSVTADDTNAPDGNTTADLLTESAVGEGHRILQTFTTVSGTTYALSAYVKANGRDFAQIFLGKAYTPANSSANFDLVNGTVTQTGGGIISAGIEAVTQGFFRIHVTFEATASASGNSGVSLADSGAANYAADYPGDGTSGIYIWGAQLEEGSFPTSYIPTAGTQVTRAADDCVRVLGDEFNPNEFSFYLEAPIPRLFDDRNAHLIEFSDGSNNNRYLLQRGVNSTDLVFAGVTPANGVIFTMTLGIAALSNQTAKISASVSSTSATLVVDGVSVSDTVSDALPVVTQFNLGAKWDGSKSIGEAVFKDVQLFPEALSESELITLTGGT